MQDVDVVRRDAVLLLEVGDVEEPLLLQLIHAPLVRVRVRVRVRARLLHVPCHHRGRRVNAAKWPAATAQAATGVLAAKSAAQ